MKLRHQTSDDERTAVPAAGEPAKIGEHRALQDQAATVVAAAGAAIARGLSRNSAEYLAQSRQGGGQ